MYMIQPWCNVAITIARFCSVKGCLLLCFLATHCHTPLSPHSVQQLCTAGNRSRSFQLCRVSLWNVTGFEKRAHFAQFWMHRLQSRVSPQYCTQSKWNMGGLHRGRCCSNEPEMKPFNLTTMTIWGGVNDIADCGAISRKWPCYQGACLRSGES